MKPKTILTAIFMMTVFFIAGNAQNADNANPPCKGKGPMYRIPDLTDAQKSKIEAIRTAHMKTATQLRNQLKEKRAHLQTLTASDNPDQKEIDATIDEITALQNKLMKNGTAMRMEIRNELTDEQKVYFDSMKSKRMNKRKMYRMSK